MLRLFLYALGGNTSTSHVRIIRCGITQRHRAQVIFSHQTSTRSTFAHTESESLQQCVTGTTLYHWPTFCRNKRSAGGRGRGSEDGSPQSTHMGGREEGWGWVRRGTEARYGLSSADDELGDIQDITSPYRPAQIQQTDNIIVCVSLICCLLLYFSFCSNTINTYTSQNTTLMQRTNCRHKQNSLQYQMQLSVTGSAPKLWSAEKKTLNTI